MILEDVDHYLGMAQELLDYTRAAISLNFKIVQLGTLLDRLTENMEQDLAQAGIRFTKNINFDRDVIIDEARVRTPVLNLVSKAANSMPDGGELTITTDEADGRWQLSVADTGLGIPRNIRSQVFVPFVNLGTDSETGLGLVIAKEVVEGHGGNLSFETRVLGEVEVQESGTSFRIEIPITPEQTP